jgi:Flp pilus assembly pilin Flp
MKEAALMFSTRRKFHGEKGQGLVEYSLILLLVAVAAVGALGVFGVSVSSVYTTIAGLP